MGGEPLSSPNHPPTVGLKKTNSLLQSEQKSWNKKNLLLKEKPTSIGRERWMNPCPPKAIHKYAFKLHQKCPQNAKKVVRHPFQIYQKWHKMVFQGLIFKILQGFAPTPGAPHFKHFKGLWDYGVSTTCFWVAYEHEMCYYIMKGHRNRF